MALPLTAHFLESSRRLLGVSSLAPAEIEIRLSSLVSRARRAHPEIELEAETLIEALAARVADGTEIADAIDSAHGADLYLATACVRGVPGALGRLEALVLGRLPAAVARIDDSPRFVAAAVERLRTKLFFGGPGRRPKLADYDGREPLGAWIRAVALRTALNLRASIEPYIQPAEDRAPEALIDGDRELEGLRDRDPSALETALEEAFGELEARQRAALRLHFHDGLEIEKIARIYRVHRATVVRWIARARDHVRARIAG